MSSNQIILYSDKNYTGTQQIVSGNCDFGCMQTGVGNDTLNSIKIPNGIKITLFENGGYQGASIRLYSDVPDLSKLLMREGTSWANQASSLQKQQQSDIQACWNQSGTSTSPPFGQVNPMVYIYSDAYYGGQYTYSFPIGKFLTQNMQDCGTQYGSILVPDGFVVTLILTDGTRIYFNESNPNIKTLGVSGGKLTNETIASINIGQADASTTAPSTTAPSTTAPSTTAPKTTAPSTTAPKTTAPTTVTNAPGALGASPSSSSATVTNLPFTTATVTNAPSTYAPSTYAPTLKSVPTTVPPSNTNLYIGIGVGVGILVLLIILFMVFSSDSDSDSGSKSGSRSGSRSEQRFRSETEYDKGRLADTDSE